jgi:hypothetical protein
MIIFNFYVACVSTVPIKRQSPLLIYPDTPSVCMPSQFFKLIGRRNLENLNINARVQNSQFIHRSQTNFIINLVCSFVEKIFGILVREAFYHAIQLIGTICLLSIHILQKEKYA